VQSSTRPGCDERTGYWQREYARKTTPVGGETLYIKIASGIKQYLCFFFSISILSSFYF
jgi:hypothetical protein